METYRTTRIHSVSSRQPSHSHFEAQLIANSIDLESAAGLSFGGSTPVTTNFGSKDTAWACLFVHKDCCVGRARGDFIHLDLLPLITSDSRGLRTHLLNVSFEVARWNHLDVKHEFFLPKVGPLWIMERLAFRPC